MGTLNRFLVFLIVVGIVLVEARYPRKNKFSKIDKERLDARNAKGVYSYSNPLKQKLEIDVRHLPKGEIDQHAEEEAVNRHMQKLASIPRLAKNLQVNQYDIDIKPYWINPWVDVYALGRNYTFDGKTNITFTMNQDASSIAIDALNLTFSTVNLWLNGSRQQLVSSAYDKASLRLTIAPVIFFKAGQTYTLEFVYTGFINNYIKGGLFWSSYMHQANWKTANDSYIVATFFEIGYGARSVFPCFDDPSFKAKFALILRYPQGFKALSNMPCAENNLVENGYITATCQQTPPMSTYLLAFAIGNLVGSPTQTVGNTTIQIWTWNGDGPNWSDRLNYALNTSATCFKALSTYLNVAYPLPKLDHLALPFFSYGGMENWGLIIYSPDYVLFHEKEEIMRDRLQGIQVRCHEMAHQWFGDLVTNEWWSEVMLHEGLADYFETYSIGLMYPQMADFANNLYVSNTQEGALRVDLSANHPVINPQCTVTNNCFDQITYAKGGSLLRMLKYTIGGTNFQTGLQNYLKAYQYGNADHNQFFNKFPTKFLSDWCGNPLNVTNFMNSWVTVPHFPTIDVSMDGSPINVNNYIASQEPFLPLQFLQPGQYNYTWYIPTLVYQYGNANDSWTWITPPKTICTNAPKEVQKDAIQIYDKYDIYNDQAPTFARIRYHDQAHNKIRQYVKNNVTSKNVPIATKIRLINDEWAYIDRDIRFLNKPSNLHRGLQIIEAVLADPSSVDFTTWEATRTVLDSIFELTRDRHEHDLYMRYLGPILENFYNKTCWNCSSSNTDFDYNLIRDDFLFYAVIFNIADARKQARSIWLANQNNLDGINPDLRMAVHCAAIMHDNGSFAYPSINQYFQRAESTGYYTSREINSMAYALACAQDDYVIQQVLNLLASNASSSFRYNLYPALSYFKYNLHASDIMRRNLERAANSTDWFLYLDGIMCALYGENNCALYPYLVGMTSLWYKTSRLEEYKAMNQTIYNNMVQYGIKNGLTNDLTFLLNLALTTTYLNMFYDYHLVPFNEKGHIMYYDMTRWMYDNYVPIGQTPWLKKITQTWKPNNYDATLKLYFPGSFPVPIGRNFTYSGQVTMTGHTIGPRNAMVSKISFNSHRQLIIDIKVYNASNNVDLGWTAIDRDYDNSIITLTLATSVPALSSIRIVVDYHGFIEPRPGEGTYMNWDYLEYNKQMSWIFATDFEGGPSTRSLIPCYDEPEQKAIWRITVQYPSDLVALSNSLDEITIHLPSGLAQTTFKPTPYMSSYLLALAVGDFASVRGVTNDNKLVRVWTWTGMQNNGKVALQATIDTINFLTSTLNVSQPLEKFDVLALPQYSGRAAGAMENWGLIISGYKTCLWNDQYSTTQQKIDSYWVTSHETVHQWFGDLVTLDWWNYIFLNEGFATFWPTVIMDVNFQNQSDWAMYYRFNDQETAFRTDSNLKNSYPIIENPIQQGYPVFGSQSYEKASSLIHMLEQTVGRTHFVNALSVYQKRHNQSNTVDANLWQAFTDEIVNDPNIYDWNGMPLDVSQYMKPWFYVNTFPILKIVTAPDGLSYTYQQTPFIQNGLNSTFNNMQYLWNVPLWTQPQNPNFGGPYDWLVSQKDSIYYFPNGYSVVNVKRRVYTRVLYDDISWAPIQAQLQQDYTVIDPITRASFIADAYALANQNLLPWSRLLNIIKYTGKAPEVATWKMLENIFGDWVVRFKFQTDVLPKLQTFINNFINQNSYLIFNNTGIWANDLTAIVFTDFACYLNNPSCLKPASDAFQAFITNCQNSAYGTGRCNNVMPDFRGAQFCFGLRQNPNQASVVQNLVMWYVNNSPFTDYWMNDAMMLLNSLSCLPNNDQVNTYINATLYNEIPMEFYRAVAETDASGNRLFTFLQNNLQKVINSIHFDNIVTNMVLGWSTDAQLASLVNFDFKGMTLSSDQAQTWNSVIASLNSTNIWMKQNKQAFFDWFTANV